MALAVESEYIKKVNSLFSGARQKQFPKNQIICYQGDTLTAIYMIKEGFIKAYTILDSGDTRTLFILGPGDIFPIAFSSTLDWHTYQLRYFYQSLTDTELAMLEQESFKQKIESDADKRNTYLAYMSASNDGILNQLEVMKDKTAKNKLEHLLPYLVDKLGEKMSPNTYRLKIKLSHQEIADLAGITRETTTALLKELEKDGIISQKRDTWIVNIEPNED